MLDESDCSGGCELVNSSSDVVADCADCDAEIEFGLEVQPGLGGDPKIGTQSKGSVGSDRAVTVNNGVNAIGRHAKVSRQPIDGDGVRFHKILCGDFAWMNGIE